MLKLFLFIFYLSTYPSIHVIFHIHKMVRFFLLIVVKFVNCFVTGSLEDVITTETFGDVDFNGLNVRKYLLSFALCHISLCFIVCRKVQCTFVKDISSRLHDLHSLKSIVWVYLWEFTKICNPHSLTDSPTYRVL